MFMKKFVWNENWQFMGMCFGNWFFGRGVLVFLVYGGIWGVFGAYRKLVSCGEGLLRYLLEDC